MNKFSQLAPSLNARQVPDRDLAPLIRRMNPAMVLSCVAKFSGVMHFTTMSSPLGKYTDDRLVIVPSAAIIAGCSSGHHCLKDGDRYAGH